jgi:hypothetical protein
MLCYSTYFSGLKVLETIIFLLSVQFILKPVIFSKVVMFLLLIILFTYYEYPLSAARDDSLSLSSTEHKPLVQNNIGSLNAEGLGQGRGTATNFSFRYAGSQYAGRECYHWNRNWLCRNV